MSETGLEAEECVVSAETLEAALVTEEFEAAPERADEEVKKVDC